MLIGMTQIVLYLVLVSLILFNTVYYRKRSQLRKRNKERRNEMRRLNRKMKKYERGKYDVKQSIKDLQDRTSG